jgi:hypothetical protein
VGAAALFHQNGMLGSARTFSRNHFLLASSPTARGRCDRLDHAAHQTGTRRTRYILFGFITVFAQQCILVRLEDLCIRERIVTISLYVLIHFVTGL